MSYGKGAVVYRRLMFDKDPKHCKLYLGYPFLQGGRWTKKYNSTKTSQLKIHVYTLITKV